MALTQTQIVDSILPEVEIKEVTIETDGEGQVFIVDYVIYDVVDRDQISRFFAKPEFEKYLKITFDYSKSPDKNYYLPRNRREILQRARSEVLGQRETKTITEMLTNDLDFRESTLEDGTRIREFTYQKKYKFNKNCEYLELFVRSFVDIEGIEEDLGLDPDTFTIDSEDVTKADLVVLFKDNNLYSKRINFNYYDEATKTTREWRGRPYSTPEYVNDQSTGRLIYSTSSDFPKYGMKLEKVEDRFDEVQDFRRREERPQQAPNYDFISRQLSNLEEQSIRKNTRSDEKKSSTSSDMWISRTVSGAVNFLFCIDIRNLLVKESQYNYYLQNFSEEAMSQIIQRVHVPSVKIFKRRLSVNQGQYAPIVVDYIDDEYKNEFLVETSKRPGSSFVESNSKHGSIKEINIPQASNLTFFTGTDYEMSEITDGVYCYGYEIKILDPTKKFLSDEISKLYPTLSVLKSVYEYLLNSINAEKKPRFYNSKTNGFHPESVQEFDINLEDFYLRPEEVFEEEGKEYSYSDFLIKAIKKYEQTFKLFKDREAQDLGYAPLGIYYAASTNPQGVKMIIRAYESLIARLSRIIGIEEQTVDIYSGKTSMSSNFIQEITSSRIYDEINELVDSNIPKGNGINYLDDPSLEFDEISAFNRELSEVGLRVITGATFEERQLSENLRYFNRQYSNISLPMNDAMTVESFDLTGEGSQYLTPSFYHMNNNHFNNNVEDTSSAETILDIGTSFSINRPIVSPSVPLPVPPAPPSIEIPSSSGFSGFSSSTRTPSIVGFRDSVATNVLSPYNISFMDFEESVTSIERYDIQDSIEFAIRNCLFTRTEPVDPLEGWTENENSESGNSTITREDSESSYSSLLGTPLIIDNFGANILSSMRGSFLSPSSISTENFSVTPPAVRSQRPISSSFDLSRDNFATSFVSSIPSSRRIPTVSRLPNQIKAMLLSSIPDQQTSVNRAFSVLNSPRGTYEVSVGFLASIEYFNGFSNGERSNRLVVGVQGLMEQSGQGELIANGLGNAIWLPLSSQVYAENKNTLLLCRIKREHFEDLGIRYSEFGTPIYDSYFLVKPVQAIFSEDGVSVEATRKARAMEEVRSVVSRRMEETELQKARLIRQIENLKQENERLHEQYHELNDRIVQYNTEMGIIFSGDMNYSGNPPGIGSSMTAYSDEYFMANMKASPRTRFFELRSLARSTAEARDRLNAQRGANEEIIAGYELAISQASDTEINTVEDVNRKHFNLQADIQTIKDEIESVAAEKGRFIELQNSLYQDEQYLRSSHAMRNHQNYEPNYYDLNEDGRFQWQILQDQINQKDEEIMQLQERERELYRLADEGEYL